MPRRRGLLRRLIGGIGWLLSGPADWAGAKSINRARRRSGTSLAWSGWQSRHPHNREQGQLARAIAGVTLCGLFAAAPNMVY